MATKTTWKSDGDVWVFEEGQYAKFTRRGETRQQHADFRVLKVVAGNQVLTNLEGPSRYGWGYDGPLLVWAGTNFVFEE